MATRADIKDAFYDRVSDLSGDYTVTRGDGSTYTVTLEPDDIRLIHPEKPETLPQVVYSDNYTTLQINDAGAAADMIARDESDHVDYKEWREYVQATFIVTVRAANDLEKEPIYEEIRRSFGELSLGGWDASALHDDVIEVNVDSGQSIDTGEAEDVIRGDQFEIQITFYRSYQFEADLIEEVDTMVDADDDGTVDYIYTTA